MSIQGAKPIDKSSSITLGGTAQEVMGVNGSRQGVIFQNTSAGDLWFDFTTTATAGNPSVKVPAGGYWEPPAGLCPVTAMSVYGATTGQEFTCWEF